MASFEDETSFNSFDEFTQKFRKYKDENFVVFRIKSSEKVGKSNSKTIQQIDPRFVYSRVHYVCTHFGQHRYRGTGVKSKTKHSATGCEASFVLRYDYYDRVLRLTKVNMVHNHLATPETYAQEHQVKRLGQQEKQTLKDIVEQLNPRNKNLLAMVNSKFGKTYTLTEIRRLKHQLTSGSNGNNMVELMNSVDDLQDEGQFLKSIDTTETITMSKEAGFWLGIDIGTTSLKVSLIDDKENEICHTHEDFGADVKSTIGEAGFEQCPQKIIQVLDQVVVPFLANYVDNISGIGITGQMHGLLLWKREKRKAELQELAPDCHSNSEKKLTLLNHLKEYKTSNLYTWQDQRCTLPFLASLPPVSDPHQPLATGHGCATLFWLLRHERPALDETGYNCCGTIMDFLTSLLCDLEHPVTSDQLAASLGYFQSSDRKWDPILQTTPEFPHRMLPSIVEAGACVGLVRRTCSGWPGGVPVLVGMGDVQCAMYSLMKFPKKAIVNIGTSIQLGFVAKSSEVPKLRQESPPTISFFPFFRPFHLALCAGLNGGNAIQHFVRSLSAWMSDLGCESQTDINSLFSRLQKLAEEDAVKCKRENKSQLSIRPSFFGERHDPEMGGSISGISTVNFQSIGHIFRCLCEGMINHLGAMVPLNFLLARGVERLSVCGSVPSRNSVVRDAIIQVYGESGLSVEMADSEHQDVQAANNGTDSQEINSAKGAAQIVKDMLLQRSS